ncbi:hypothetical protein [Saccharothrix obliqua]|uniref:hypothetical protein n=1 Tax=Saccharothrix obliqua TaxID=2861747 RepID=UPI001C5CE67D|nr:hypothetical protein [Saccharothrix obliqua]MBW4721313.1 hypothetical protein [Saccharothrix obliqua]
MTTTNRHNADPLRSLPLLVAGFAVVVAVVLAFLAPDDGTVYRVTTGQFTAYGPHCEAEGTITRCTVPVGQRTLVVSTDVGPAGDEAGCTAAFAGQPVACTRDRALNNVFTHALRVSGLSVPEEDAREVRAAQPWWAGVDDKGVTFGLLWLVFGASAGAAGATWLLSRKRLAPERDRRARLAFVAVAAVLPVVAACALLNPASYTGFLGPAVVLAPAVLSLLGWQWLLGGGITGRLRQRVGLTAVAFGVTAAYSTGTVMWLSFMTGLVA